MKNMVFVVPAMAIFGKKPADQPESVSVGTFTTECVVIAKAEVTPLLQGFLAGIPSVSYASTIPDNLGSTIKYLVVLDSDYNLLTRAARAVRAARDTRGDGLPVLIVNVDLSTFTGLGEWLNERASASELSGLRVFVGGDGAKIKEDVQKFLHPVEGSDVVQMPTAPEIPNSPLKSIFTLSPDSRRIVKFIGELAQNGVTRVYLLGAPGAGKTSLAYYYWLKRGKGNFITVNLNSESTGDKASMKSLLCGHVAGSSPGAQTREGALSFARDGVCFLDESHGATGSVMQVLMEVLENGQFLPFGATAKRPLDCAVLFASNRSWEVLRGLMHIDEHARLGATIVEISDLKFRQEDLIAVIATTLSRMKGKFNTWKAPTGISAGAWQLLSQCGWRGNVRSLMRVIESAAVEFGQKTQKTSLLEVEHIKPALELWEPEQTTDEVKYASFSAR